MLLAKAFKALNKTVLKLGVMCTIAPYCLIGMITAVRTRHPGIELVDAGAGELDDRLLNGDPRSQIYCLLPDDEGDDRLHRTLLFEEQMMIVVRPDHPFALKKFRQGQDTGWPSVSQSNEL